jgi:hypothetical protein
MAFREAFSISTFVFIGAMFIHIFSIYKKIVIFNIANPLVDRWLYHKGKSP